MTTALKIVVYFLVPTSLLFLLLLVIPVPVTWRKKINALLSRVIFFKLVAGLSFIGCVIGVSVISFVMQIQYLLQRKFGSDGEVSAILNDRTKIHQLEGQRNMWIALLLLVLWTMVYLVLRLSDKLALAEQNLTLAMGLKFEEINSQSESEARLNGKQELSTSKQDLDTNKKME